MKTESIKEHSIARRYIYKVASSLLSMIVSIAMAGVVPRALGVKAYGDFSFLTNFFQQLAGFLDFRTSTYFFVRLSQDQNDKKLITFYGSYLAIVVLAFFTTTGILVWTPLQGIVLPNQISKFIFMGAVVGCVAWLLDVFVGCMDAYGVTVDLEKARLVNKLVSAGVLLILSAFSLINLENAYLYQIITGLSLIFFVAAYLIRKGVWKDVRFRIDWALWVKYARDFYIYSYPLFGYGILSFYVVIFDRWLLQRLSGSLEQGLYSFAFSLMSFGYLFIIAIQPLLIREMSVAAAVGDSKRMAILYRRIYPLLFAVTAYFCAFLFVEADVIVGMFGGGKYGGSIAPFRILMAYPLINVFSGLNSSIILTTKKTKIFLVLSSIFAPIGSLLLFLLIDHRFFSLGAKGIATKVILIELSSVIVITIIIGRYVQLRASKTLLHFFYATGFIIFSWLARALVDNVIMPRASSVIVFLSCGVVYSCVILFAFSLFPQLLGVAKCERDKIYMQIINGYKKVVA